MLNIKKLFTSPDRHIQKLGEVVAETQQSFDWLRALESDADALHQAKANLRKAFADDPNEQNAATYLSQVQKADAERCWAGSELRELGLSKTQERAAARIRQPLRDALEALLHKSRATLKTENQRLEKIAATERQQAQEFGLEFDGDAPSSPLQNEIVSQIERIERRLAESESGSFGIMENALPLFELQIAGSEAGQRFNRDGNRSSKFPNPRDPGSISEGYVRFLP